MAHIYAAFSSPAFSVLHRIAFPVVSEWCQSTPVSTVSGSRSASVVVELILLVGRLAPLWHLESSREASVGKPTDELVIP